MKDDAPCKRILVSCVNAYNSDRTKGSINMCNSPMYELCNVAGRVNLLDSCCNMVINGQSYAKKVWSRIVWEHVWLPEDEEIQLFKNQLSREKLLFQIVEKPYYLTWWVVSDVSRENMYACENMARMVCETSLLKSSDVRLKKTSIASRFCCKCDLSSEETAFHLAMQCPFFESDRKTMYDEMSELKCPEINGILNESGNIFLYLMGKHPPGIEFMTMYPFWTIAARHISRMYDKTTSGR